jgi:hypothetical protein
MMREPIYTKHENFRRWRAGDFGNKLRAWRTIEEWRASGFAGKVVLRALLDRPGGPCRYNLHPDEVERTAAYWIAEGLAPAAIMVNEAAPDSAAILQGEYLNDVVGGKTRYFFYSKVAAHMRVALGEQPRHSTGLATEMLLRAAMTPSSYADWCVLLDEYPGHVLEVSVYSHCVGDIPGRNALVWEVRRY